MKNKTLYEEKLCDTKHLWHKRAVWVPETCAGHLSSV